MKQQTIGKRIALGFTAIIVISALLGGFAQTRLDLISKHLTRIDTESAPAVQACNQIKVNVKDTLERIYQHIGSEDKQDMMRLDERIAATTKQNTDTYEQLGKLVTTGQGQELLKRVQASRASYGKARDDVMVLSRQGTNNIQAYHLARTQLDPASDRYTADLDALAKYCLGDADQATKAIHGAVLASRIGNGVGVVGTLVLGVIIALGITRGTGRLLSRVARSLDDGAAQVTSAAHQVASSSQSLAEGASEQAASLEETSSSLEEMSSLTRQNAENAQKANDLAKQARSVAERGAGDMQEMMAAMEGIKSAGDDIAKIIRTIDEIAFQTNILALNAAVEAARAGEAGMGFAVVADEVRSLAQRAAQAAKETSGKIEGAITRTAAGVAINQKVAQALSEIVTRVREVDQLVAEVAVASREQSQGFNQVNLAVNQMDKVTQGNAANAEEGAAAAEELSAQADSMKAAVAELLLLVGGAAHLETQAATRAVTPGPGYPQPKLNGTAKPACNLRLPEHNGNGNGAHDAKPPKPVIASVRVSGKPGETLEDGFRDM